MNAHSRPTVLILAHRVPGPPDKGDRIRTLHLLKFLARHARVHLACLADEPVEEATVAALEGICERVAIFPLRSWARWPRALWSLARGHTITEGAFGSPALRKSLRSWAREVNYQACMVSASSMVPYLKLKELQGVPAVVDLMDVDSQKWLDYAAAHRGPRAWLYGTEGRRLRRLEQQLPAWARGVLLVGEAEAQLYRQFCAEGPVQAVTNGVDLDFFQPCPPAREEGCVFVGALDYFPNVDGSDWFCREVWPELLRRRPHTRLRLVGRRPAPAVRRLAELPGVEVVGQVPDVRPYLAESAVSIVPLRIARGVQNKVLEALAMGKATVASPPTTQGLRVRPGEHLLVASTPAEWVDALLALLDDPALRTRFGTAGRRYVEENHHWDRCLEKLPEILGLGSADPSPGTPPERRAEPKARAELLTGNLS